MSTKVPGLILASTSSARIDLLRRLEVDFEAVAPHFDERTAGLSFAPASSEAFATHLARSKASSLAGDHAGTLVLAADQIAVLDGCLLTKPTSTEDAISQLCALSGRTHTLITAVCLLDTRSGARHEAVDHQRMTMRAFDEREARAYVIAHRPLECVGSYRIEDAGIKLFERIEGSDFTGIIGLPLLAVARLLRGVGLL